MAQQLLRPEPRNKTAFSGFRVLVVEDWWIVAQELRARLESLECQVVGPTPSIDKAMKLAADPTLNGAILDIDLNGRRVYPVAELLLQRGLPFFFATGFDSPHVTEHYRGIPQLRKPYAFPELQTMMEHVFSKPPGSR